MPTYRYRCLCIDGHGVSTHLTSKPFLAKDNNAARRRILNDIKKNERRDIAMLNVILERGSLVTVKRKIFRSRTNISL